MSIEPLELRDAKGTRLQIRHRERDVLMVVNERGRGDAYFYATPEQWAQVTQGEGSARIDLLESALRGVLAEPYGCTHCDSGKARDEAKGHQPDCPFEAARAAIAAREAAEEWKSIDCAPKDGTWILLWWPYWNFRVLLGRYYKGAWEAETAISDADDAEPPLFWRPLPPPPSTALEGK